MPLQRARRRRLQTSCRVWRSGEESRLLSRSEIRICFNSCRGWVHISSRGVAFRSPRQQRRAQCSEHQQSRVTYRSAYRHTQVAGQERKERYERVEQTYVLNWTTNRRPKFIFRTNRLLTIAQLKPISVVTHLETLARVPAPLPEKKADAALTLVSYCD